MKEKLIFCFYRKVYDIDIEYLGLTLLIPMKPSWCFMLPIATCIKKTFDCNGRADLVEFWSFFMFLCLIQMLAFL